MEADGSNDKDNRLFENRKLVLTYAEAANALGLSLSALQKMVHRKEIPFAKIGHRVRFIPDDLVAWLNTKKG